MPQPFSSRQPEIAVSRRELLKSGLAAGLLACGAGPLILGGCRRNEIARPNILLITLDTTRADHLGCYGYHRPTSPHLDRLAEESTVYTDAIATSSWTLPSHASLFTGKLTTGHGARYDARGPICLADALSGVADWQRYRARGLAPGETTLAELLRQSGYGTGAVVAGPWLKKIFGLHQGFDFYDEDRISSLNGRLARDVTARAAQWLSSRAGKPFFLFLNYFDPHEPYAAPEGLTGTFMPRGQTLGPSDIPAALYDAEILYMDRYIGKLLDTLRQLKLYDRTWIIITADHGELLGEHGLFGHGKFLFQPELHVPLIIKYPRGERSPGSTDKRVQLNDILPAVCSRLSIPVPEALQGEGLPRRRSPVIAETYPLPAVSPAGDWRAIYAGDYKLIWNSKGRHLLFNLGSDPAEETNIAPGAPGTVQDMTRRMNRYLDSLPRPAQAGADLAVDNATRKALQGLGYME